MKDKRTSSALRAMDRRFYRGRPDRVAEREQTAREMRLGDKIRQLREEQGWTQQQLADKIKTQASAISRIESADYDRHSIALLERIAKALGVMLCIDFAPRQPIKRVGKMM